MIDITLLRSDFDWFAKNIKRKDPSFDSSRLKELDEELRAIRSDVELIRSQRNELAAKGAGGVSDQVRATATELGKKLKQKEQDLARVEVLFKELVLSCPNILFDEVPDDTQFEGDVVSLFGEKKNFEFKPKNHVEIGTVLGLFDFEVAASMSGAQFPLYKGDAVKMLYALTTMMLRHNALHGFEPVLPPYLVNEKALTNSGNLPKFKADVYHLERDGLYLIPTAEVGLTNVHAGEILSAEVLPLRYCAWTSCFRREAGGYGASERGLIRIHQFEKVELYTICRPDDAAAEYKRMVTCAEEFLQALGLHYRVRLLPAHDCSFSSAKTCDIEVWLPGQERYYEVSSVSNCTDFQSRRAKIRYRQTSGGKIRFVHTLNASSLALPRLMVALLETYQTRDGSLELPLKLRQAMDAFW